MYDSRIHTHTYILKDMIIPVIHKDMMILYIPYLRLNFLHSVQSAAGSEPKKESGTDNLEAARHTKR